MKKVVVLGMMSKMPVAGVVWQTVHYLLGFERLGYEAYYVEAHARTPSMLMEHENDNGSARAAAFIDGIMRRFGLGGRWAFQALHDDGRCYGLSQRTVDDLYRAAELIVNLHGGTQPLPGHVAGERLVYVETDPVQLQIELEDGLKSTIEFLESHVAFFTFAENYGSGDCLLPVTPRFKFHQTRQPVVLDLWSPNDQQQRAVFTTVGNWKQHWRDVRYQGETYTWSKHHEFAKFLDLPLESGRGFELALASLDDAERTLLEEHGWRVRSAREISCDPDVYRAYISSSCGEWTVAKDQNVRFRSGWFSDRSATYLASGRPVITQETGFSNVLPTGAGLLGFGDLDDLLAALENVCADHGRHCEAAMEIAREYFDSDVVLRQLLDEVGLRCRR